MNPLDILIKSCISNLTGWPVFAAPVLRLISLPLIHKKLGCFAAMVRILVEYDRPEEAKEVAHKISSIFEIDGPLRLRQSDLNVYVDAVIALDTCKDTKGGFVSLERLVIPVFAAGFSPLQQCNLLIDLQKNHSYRLKNSPSFLNLYKNICRLLLHDRLYTSAIVPGSIRQVVDCYLKLGDKEILEMFICHVFLGKCLDNLWIGEFLTTADPATLTLLYSCLEKRTDAMKSLAVEPLGEDENVKRVELFRLFAAILHLQTHLQTHWLKFPLLNFSARLTAFDSIYPRMPEDRLNNLIVDLVRGGIVNKYPCSFPALYNMARSLLGRSQTEEPQVVISICQLLEQFSTLLDDKFLYDSFQLVQESQSSAKKFVRVQVPVSYSYLLVRAICLNCKWSQWDQNRLMKSIFSSSEMWKNRAGTNQSNADIAQKCLAHLMTSWIAGLEQLMAVPSVSLTERNRLRANVAACLSSYVKETKKGRDLGSDIFSSLLSKMGMQELSHLAWDVYQLDVKDTTSLKSYPKTLNTYRNLYLRLLDAGEKSRDWISNWTEPNADNMLIETTSCLLWLGDDNLNSLFTNFILTSSEPNVIISTIIKSEAVLKLARSLLHAKDSLCAILEKRLLADARTWVMPHVNLPEHPTVQEFLHSSDKEMTYANFSSREQASEFSNVLNLLGTDNGYAVMVKKIIGTKFNSRCQIVKINKLPKSAKGKVTAAEKAELNRTIASIKSQFEAAEDNDEAGTSGTPAKKQRVQ